MAEALMSALKPEKFEVSQKGNPDTLLAEFNEYVKKLEQFAKACNLDISQVSAVTINQLIILHGAVRSGCNNETVKHTLFHCYRTNLSPWKG